MEQIERHLNGRLEIKDLNVSTLLDLDFKDTPESKCIINSQKPYISELYQRLRFDDAKSV